MVLYICYESVRMNRDGRDNITLGDFNHAQRNGGIPMRSLTITCFGHRATHFIVIISAAALLFTMLPLGSGLQAVGASPPAYEPATFDLFSMFPQQFLSPSTGRTMTWMPLETRNIADVAEWTWLTAQSESPYFSALVMPPLVRTSGAGSVAKSWVLVCCSPSTPDGTIGYIKVTGVRGSEQHRVWLKVTALASQPQLENSPGDLLTGQGYKDPTLQAYTGESLSWCLAATNQGGTMDTYTLSYESDFPCEVKFVSTGGAEIGQVTVAGRTHNYLYSTPVYFYAEVTPTAALPKNQPLDVTFILGPGVYSASTSKVTVQVMNPGMVYCANDMDGMRPHAHQVMAGETTSFMFHVTNLDASAAGISLAVSGDAGDWDVGLDKDMITGLPAKASEQVVLKAIPSPTAAVGDRLDLTMTATSSLGAVESVDIAAEVTDVRNVYYFSIDSMDPEYLYLNRAGTGPGSEGDWLMPNLRAFMGDGVNYSDARVYLPSATDMNHTNALAGTYTGTQGLYMVGGTFIEFTEHDEVISAANSMDLMRYGPEGKPLERIYEVAKEETGGKSLTGFWSNKNWLADIEGEKTVDIVGHSARYPLFFPAPYKYSAAGDPPTDENPSDPLSGPFSACFYTDTTREVLVPALLGQFNLLLGLGLYVMPISLIIGRTPGNHCEDSNLMDSFMRSIIEEDPDVCYVNAADLDNTGHFTGSSWTTDEWDTKGTAGAVDDVSMFSPWMRRDDCLDITREVDLLFAQFIQLLKERGVYDNSIIVVLSDHGMENMKDYRNGYEVLDLRRILRERGLLLNEDYYEGGGTEINFIWCDDSAKLQAIEEILEGYTVDDPVLGAVQPLIVINREETISGVDYDELGHVRPMELYSEFWVDHPDEPDGHLWPDLFIFPRYNYNVAAHGQVLASAINPVGLTLGNVPDSVQVGFPGAHGGLQTAHMPLIFKAPSGWSAYAPGTAVTDEVEIGDITPTIYRILGWEPPPCVDGEPLPD
jgi:Type I phosphodiesterase / nucleotide pyrophosphatase